MNKITEERVNTWSHHTEMLLLSSCIQGESPAVSLIISLTKEEHFHNAVCRAIWQAIAKEYRSTEGVNVHSVYNRLNLMASEEPNKEIFYNETITTLISSVNGYTTTSRHIIQTAKYLHYIYTMRSAGTLYEMMGRTVGDSGDLSSTLKTVIDKSQSLYNSLQYKKPLTFGEVIDKTIQSALDRKNSDNKKLLTGIDDLDAVIGGLFPPDLVIIAGRPSLGKTDLLINILFNLGISGHPTGFISLEMGDVDVGARLICLQSGVFRSKFRTGEFDSADLDAIELNRDLTKKLSINLLSEKCDTARIRNWTADQVLRNGIKLLAVDYLGLITPGRGTNREQQVSAISADLKGIALEFNIPVIAVSQINRGVESRDQKRPQMSDLRDSGSIEQDADIIMMIYRESYYAFLKGQSVPPAQEDWLEINVVKNRQGETKNLDSVSYNRATGHIGRGGIIHRTTSITRQYERDTDVTF